MRAGNLKRLLVFLMALVFLATTAATRLAVAETYVGAGLGSSLRMNLSDFEGETTGYELSLSDFNSDSTLALGLKVGHFFEALPSVGIEFNFSISDPDIKRDIATANIAGTPAGIFTGQVSGDFLVTADVNFLSTFGLLAVWRVTDKQFLMNLDGLVPFLGLGVGISTLDIEKVTVTTTAGSFIGETSGESNTSLGFLLSAGFNYNFTDHFAGYTEFKYKETNFEYDELDGAVKYNFDDSESSVVFGLAYRF
ncbi:hypothetical protein UR09_02595 [Candidatus Nitromaritima sp. SCGC AAA799-A02]|nr:hypothetical protein UR09_02595 [Candidatus Nitromaritima sp. SCGC AAA799-A02]KMP11869.1 hypothetical protein UZ36_02820 [Candidatus Nitromaritima sp. SCGC AAA799-C22]